MQLNADTVKTFHCPRWQELPTIPLYMDQVVIVLEGALALFADADEKVLTSTMVNNYVKQRLVPPPVKKKYGREQLSALVVVSLLKRVLSMSEITELTAELTTAYGTEAGYDLFCERLEVSLQAVFAIDKPQFVLEGADVAAALDAALGALCGKLYLQNHLARHKPPIRP
ncbi:MAG: DUF1836 domain-containing protein [Oscillospiraceae bacterium]|jgi:hypothetical protein